MIFDSDSSWDGCKGTPQAERGRQTAGSAFWEPEEGEPLLCNPFSTTPKQEARRCPFWQPLSSGFWEAWFLGSVSVSEFTSTGLEERNQLMLAAWTIRVCVGGRLQATWGTRVSLRLQPPPPAPSWEGFLGHRPLQSNISGGCIKGIPPDGGIPWG